MLILTITISNILNRSCTALILHIIKHIIILKLLFITYKRASKLNFSNRSTSERCITRLVFEMINYIFAHETFVFVLLNYTVTSSML